MIASIKKAPGDVVTLKYLNGSRACHLEHIGHASLAGSVDGVCKTRI